MTIQLDSTKISTVVTCTRCPWWHGFADCDEQGWRVGASHEERAHADGESLNAREALRLRATRRAAREMTS